MSIYHQHAAIVNAATASAAAAARPRTATAATAAAHPIAAASMYHQHTTAVAAATAAAAMASTASLASAAVAAASVAASKPDAKHAASAAAATGMGSGGEKLKLLRIKRRRDDPPLHTLVVAGSTPTPAPNKRVLLKKVRHALSSLSVDSSKSNDSKNAAATAASTDSPADTKANEPPRMMFKLLDTVTVAESIDKALPSRLMDKINALRAQRNSMAVAPEVDRDAIKAAPDATDARRERQRDELVKRAQQMRGNRVDQRRFKPAAAPTGKPKPSASAGARPLATADGGSAIATLLASAAAQTAANSDVLKDSFDLVDLQPLTADVYSRTGGDEKADDDDSHATRAVGGSEEEKRSSPGAAPSVKLSTLSRRNADRTSCYLPTPIPYPVNAKTAGTSAAVVSTSVIPHPLASGSHRSTLAFNAVDPANVANSSGTNASASGKPHKYPKNHHQAHQRKAAHSKPGGAVGMDATAQALEDKMAQWRASEQQQQQQRSDFKGASSGSKPIMTSDETMEQQKANALASLLREQYGGAASSIIPPTATAAAAATAATPAPFQLQKPKTTASFSNPSGGSLSSALFPLQPTVVVAPPAPATAATSANLMDDHGASGTASNPDDEFVYDVYVVREDVDPFYLDRDRTATGDGDDDQSGYVHGLSALVAEDAKNNPNWSDEDVGPGNAAAAAAARADPESDNEGLDYGSNPDGEDSENEDDDPRGGRRKGAGRGSGMIVTASGQRVRSTTADEEENDDDADADDAAGQRNDMIRNGRRVAADSDEEEDPQEKEFNAWKIQRMQPVRHLIEPPAPASKATTVKGRLLNKHANDDAEDDDDNDDEDAEVDDD